MPGHKFELNANFEEVKPESYDALIIPGGRFTELLSVDEKCLTVVTKFAETGRTILCTCHSQLMLAAAGVLKGKKCTGFGSMKPVIELAGGTVKKLLRDKSDSKNYFIENRRKMKEKLF